MASPTVVDAPSFREAMARFASGVTVVATRGSDGTPAAFTASAFSSLSLDPPLVLVCQDRRADSFPVFETAGHFTVSVLTAGQAEAARRFAAKGADKFAGAVVETGSVTGLPLVPDALVHLECRTDRVLDGGDHIIIVGEVLRAASRDAEPLLHFQRQFGRFAAG